MAPPPRMLSRWSRAWVVAGCTAAATALCVEQSHQVEAWLNEAGFQLRTPWFAWGALLLGLIVLLTLFSNLTGGRLRRALSVLLRTLVITALLAALMSPHRSEEVPTPVSLAVAIDLSESVSEVDLKNMQHLVTELAEASEDVAPLWIGFATEARRLDHSGSRAGAPHLTHLSDGRQTNIARALQLALASLPEHTDRRILLLTDGMQTRGNALAQLPALQRAGVTVFVHEAADNSPPSDLVLSDLDAPRRIKRGESLSLRADLEFTQGAEVDCHLLIDGEKTRQQTVKLGSERHSLTFDSLSLKRRGEHVLRVECHPPANTVDRFQTNNRVEQVVYVQAPPRLLLVDGEGINSRDLPAALEAEFDITVRGPAGLPRRLSKMQEFDVIVLSDLRRFSRSHHPHVSQRQMGLLNEYIAQGGTFVMAGGVEGLGDRDYVGTRLESKVLPVWLDSAAEKQTAEVALALVVDKSGSMSGLKLELAKDAASATLEVLAPEDYIAVIAFDAEVEPIVPVQRAANRLRIANNLARLKSGGGTRIRPALLQAHAALSSVDARIKHVILLTDGRSEREGVLSSVRQLFHDAITVSTVAVGEAADGDLLGTIASMAGGRYYRTRDPSNIPKLFVQETRQLDRSAAVVERFRPQVERKHKHIQAFAGIGSLPRLNGYISTRAKQAAEILVSSPTGEPILARQRIGAGWSIAWTSDLKARWARSWFTGNTGARLWRQLLRASISLQTTRVQPLSLKIERGTLAIRGDVVDKYDDFVNGLRAVAKLQLPDGSLAPLELTQEASGAYAATVPAPLMGSYRVTVDYLNTDGEKIATAEGAVTQVCPTEHMLASQVDTQMLDALAKATGGTINPQVNALLASQRVHKTQNPAWPLLMLVALSLFVLDVLNRRIPTRSHAA